MGDSVDAFTGEQMQVIAQGMCGMYPLTPDVAEALAADTEYFVREVLQLALTFQAHTKQHTLSPMHIASALRVITRSTPLGYGSSFPSHALPFKAVPLCHGLYVPADRVLALDAIRDMPLPKRPKTTTTSINNNNNDDDNNCILPRAAWLRPPSTYTNDTSLQQIIANAVTMSKSVYNNNNNNNFLSANETDDEDEDDDDDEGDQVNNNSKNEKRRKKTIITSTLADAVSSLVGAAQGNLRAGGDASVLSRVLETILAIASDGAPSVRTCAHDFVRVVLSILLASNGPGDRERRLAAATLARIFYIFEDVAKLASRALRTLVIALNNDIDMNGCEGLEVTYGAVLGMAAFGSEMVRLFLTPLLPSLKAQLNRALKNRNSNININNDEMESERVAELVANICDAIVYACDESSSPIAKPEQVAVSLATPLVN